MPYYKTFNNATVATLHDNLALESARADSAEKVNAKAIADEATAARAAETDLHTQLTAVSATLAAQSTKEAADIADLLSKLQAEATTARAAEAAATQQLTVLNGYITSIYQYLFSSSPTVPPTR